MRDPYGFYCHFCCLNSFTAGLIDIGQVSSILYTTIIYQHVAKKVLRQRLAVDIGQSRTQRISLEKHGLKLDVAGCSISLARLGSLG